MTEHKLTPQGNVRYTIDLAPATMQALKAKADRDYNTVAGEIRKAANLMFKRDKLVEGLLTGTISLEEYKQNIVALIVSV